MFPNASNCSYTVTKKCERVTSQLLHILYLARLTVDRKGTNDLFQGSGVEFITANNTMRNLLICE